MINLLQRLLAGFLFFFFANGSSYLNAFFAPTSRHPQV
jgi:hypothetical protein